MQMAKKLGDFTGLAGNYAKYRPAYSASVLTAILSLVEKPVTALDFVDVGAGTGIWTRMVAERKPRSVIAVEPNDDMRSHGEADDAGLPIQWRAGKGEQTGLPDESCDLLTMASSFHWVDFERGTREFHRVLRPGGRFCALWNPRWIEANPLLVEIENKLYELAPNIKRVSSGLSGITETLTEQLNASPFFDDVVYLEGRHVMQQTPEHYLGVWRSVNDIRVQAGEERFARFLDFVEQKVAGLDYVETTYLTRAWTARRV
ncbi:MAG: class I SAM-dependent methyltransferase [Hydrogenophilales bacterium]|nr:class I SAM-dependent methyltransferase [Hydrogenophilales bacterium]